MRRRSRLVVREARAEAAHREATGARRAGSRARRRRRGTSSIVCAMRDAATSAPASSTSCLKIWRSSPLLIASKLAPMSSTSYFVEDPVVVQVDRGVQRRLAAQRRQDRVGPLLGDDRLDDLPRDRLDVGRVGEVGVGHDRRRVRVDQDDAHALLAQHAARLGARVVELARLADDDRAGADDEDALDVVALGHYCVLLAEVSRRRGRGTGRRGSWRRAGRRRLRGGTAPRRPGCRGRAGPRPRRR